MSALVSDITTATPSGLIDKTDTVNSKVDKLLLAINSGEKLVTIDLSNCNLTSIPIEVFQCHDSLEVLNLGGNNLESLPDSMIKLQKLRVLFFAQNKFKSIPIILGKLYSLFMLSFKSNQIEYIDHESLSPTICWLILTDNKISQLPHSIGLLKGLRKLMLAGNELTSLPDDMKNCQVIVCRLFVFFLLLQLYSVLQ